MKGYDYQTYRYTKELCFVENQSMVECRFPGAETAVVLAVQARVVESDCACVDGEVKYSGKLLLSIVYEDVNKRICRAERGAEFFHKAASVQITPACFAKGNFEVENITHRREGASTYVSVVIGARIKIYTQAEVEYLDGGEEVVVKKQAGNIVQVSTLFGEVEESDDFEMDGIVDVLMHEEKARVISAKAGPYEVEIEGEICYDVCALKEDGGVERLERILPIKMKLPCEESGVEDMVKAALEVRRAEVSLSISEEDNRAKITFVCGVYADCTLYKKVEVEMGADAFSPRRKIHLKRQKVAGRYLLEQKNESFRVAGTAANSFWEEGWRLCCIFLPRVEISKQDGGIEGVLEVSALLRSEEGGYKVSTLTLPFASSTRACAADEIVCTVSGLTVRNFSKEATCLEGTIHWTIARFEAWETEYIAGLEEGEDRPKKEAAFTIFVPAKGDGLWEVAKKMGVAPDEVERCNPEVSYPVKEGERIIVYRQKC